MSLRPPARPNLEYLKKQAKDVLGLVHRHKPGWKLADAQHAIARGYGFSSWPKLKSSVEARAEPAAAAPSPNQRLAARIVAVAKPAIDSAGRSQIQPPLVGVWTAAPSQDLILEFGVVGDTVTITQVAVDASGREVAARVAFTADGHEHPAAHDQGHMVQANWAHSHLLNAVHKNGDQILARVAYEVSPDGSILSVSANGHVILLHRLPCLAAMGRY